MRERERKLLIHFLLKPVSRIYHSYCAYRFDVDLCSIEHESGDDVTSAMLGGPVESRVAMDEVLTVDEVLFLHQKLLQTLSKEGREGG